MSKLTDLESQGEADGIAAASWVFDGNSARHAYMSVLGGIEDGEPQMLDALPQPIPDDALTPTEQEAYDLAFLGARDSELTRVCLYMLGEDASWPA